MTKKIAKEGIQVILIILMAVGCAIGGAALWIRLIQLVAGGVCSCPN